MATTTDLISDVRKRLEKRYKDSTELFPDLTTARKIDVIKSGSSIVDAVTGVGGFPRGRVTEVHGPYSSGKTTLAIEAMISCQKDGGTPLFEDYEHALDMRYAHHLGLDLSPDKFIYIEPDYFEQGADAAMAFMDAGLVDLLVFDSAAAMTPKSALEGVMDTDGGSQKGTQAALMAQFLAKVTKLLSKGRRPAMIFLEQMRANINIGGRPQKNAPKEQPAGGNAMKFYSSLRLLLEIITPEGADKRDTKGTDQVYTQNKVRVTAVKNKLAPPWIRGDFAIKFGEGYDNIGSIASLAEARLGIMSGAGYFKYNGEKPATSFSCRGREEFLEILKQDPDITQELERKVLEAIQQEHAKALGFDSIKQEGKAKTIEADPGTMYLDDDRDPDDKPKGLNGHGLPTDDLE